MKDEEKRRPRADREAGRYTVRYLFRIVGPTLIVIAIYLVLWLVS